MIPPEPNLRLTSDKSVNSSLSIVVQKIKTERAIYPGLVVALTIFQIVKLRFFTIFDSIQKILRGRV